MKGKKLLVKGRSIPVLVNQYTTRLKKYLETGAGMPDPQSFIEIYAKKALKSELQMHLNLNTLLLHYGREQKEKALKALKKGNFLEKSKQRFFDKLKKSSGTQRTPLPST
jgi:hypothetical protein